MGAGYNPLVSVVIPTLGRPALVARAIRSALTQTHANVEVIVVSDGPDPETAASLAGCDPRVRYMPLAANAGPAAARNAGMLASRGEWINLLDDDDELLPTKIAAQLAMADPADEKTMIACRLIFDQGSRQDVWPDRPIGKDERMGDYLLRRPGLRGRPGVLNLHCLLIPRALALAVPMEGFADHEDWAWLLELESQAGARVRFLWEPLAVYRVAVSALTRSRRDNWADSLEWARAHRRLISRAAFNSFVATKVALKAKRSGSGEGLKAVAKELLGNRPSLLDLAFFFVVLVTPNAVANRAWRASLENTETGSVQRKI